MLNRLLSHPEVSDEPEEETIAPQALGTAASSTAAADSNADEGKYIIERGARKELF